ncbi:N-acetylglucosamine-6-phosphate deacetylase [Sinomonas sp. P47F7]|uniref:N-acetylglucosamine-6-phosphate deacetylase n=1 Tax=Sinomonas sp. P47F7 TaxID=3410987 RepID=UPI003BF4FCD3
MTAPTRGALRGRDLESGGALEIEHDGGVITAVRRLGVGADDLPFLAPGFVDLQVNGFAGHDVNGPEASAQDVVDITAALARTGVTTWLPTIITASEEQIVHSLRTVAEARAASPAAAAAIPGVHVEGPFISEVEGARGVHDPAQIRPLDPAEVRRWETPGAPLEILTVSPHGPDAPARIAEITALGISVAIGHTHATADEVRAAADAGARLSTHLGNGMPSLIPRHPNAIWAQLADDRLAAGFIADGHHLPADTLTSMLRAKPSHGAFLVSDATALAGCAPGTYTAPVGGAVVLGADGRLSAAGTGYLAGAALGLAEGVRRAATAAGIGLRAAVRLATVNPARQLRRARPGLGSLTVGAPADCVLLDGTGHVVEVVQGGRTIA